MSFSSLKSSTSRNALALAVGAAIMSAPFAAFADANIDEQIKNLQAQVDVLKKRLADAPKPAPAPSLVASDGSITLYGITLYGVVDMGLSYQNHGTTVSPYWGQGATELISKNSSGAHFNVTPSGMSQSSIGLKGKEEFMPDWYAVFQLESGFNPQSGNLVDGPKGLTQNNGNANTWTQVAGGDSSRAGQVFNGAANVGASNATFGTLLFGRNGTLLKDSVGAADPFNGSYAFSLIGNSSQAQAGGFSQAARLDNSIKYTNKTGIVRYGALYQAAGNTNINGNDQAFQGKIGIDYQGLSLDAIYAKKKDAVSYSSDSATAALGTSRLKATIADQSAYGVMGSYDLKPVKIYGGYEHIAYQNPKTPINQTFSGLGGYYVSSINNASLGQTKNLHVIWLGGKYAYNSNLDLIAGVFEYVQENFSGIEDAKCLTTSSATSGGTKQNTMCAGTETVASISADYKFNKRFDVYGGVMYSRLFDGLYINNGYLHNNAISPMVGARFQF